MHNVITTYGGGELFFLVFNGISALFKTEGGIIVPMVRLGLMVGSVYVVTLMLFRHQLIEGLRWFLWVIVATNLLFLPKVRIHIYDPLNSYHRDVDNVPLALGVFAGLVSQIGKTVTEHLETAFTLPGYMPYHKTGTVFASSLMSQVGKFRIVDPVFKGNMERFVNQCIVYDAMIGHKYTLNDLQNTSNIWELVTTQASPVLGFLYKDGQAPGAVLTCREGARQLNELWAAEIERATFLFGSQLQNRRLEKATFNAHLQGSASLLSGAAAWAESAQNILKQEMMINAIEEGSNNKLSELGSASNYAATKALLQQRSAYATAGEIAARTLPLFKNVIEALSYALFIFIVVLALLPNGYRTLLTYCGILVWTQLWAPLYAVLNLIMTLYGQAETLGHGAQAGLTLLNSSAIINTNADMTTLAAWLSVSIPFISYGILKQGAGAFVGLAQHLGSAMQSAASSAAAETASGNISLGNITMGTQAYQNTSAFQHNTSPSYTASQFKAMDTSGIETSTFAGGDQSFTDQAISRLGIQIMGTENTSFSAQESLNKALNVAQTKTLAASEATEASLQHATNFLSQVGSHISQGEDWNKSLSATETKSLQNFKNYVDDIRQNTGLTENQAVEAALSARLGLEFFGTGLGGSSNFSSNAARQKAVDSAKSIANQRGYSENFEQLSSAAQSFSEAHQDTHLQELGKGATASLNTANSLRQEVTLAQNQVDTLSKDLSSSQSQSFIVSKELTQDILEFIAHQPVNQGPDGAASSSPIGYDGARQILEKGGEERAAYIKHFQEAHPQYVVQSINTAHEQEHLTHRYDTESTKMQKDFAPTPHHTQQTQEVLAQGKASGLEFPTPPSEEKRATTAALPQSSISSAPAENKSSPSPSAPPTPQEAIQGFISEVTSKITQGQKEINQKEQDLQKIQETTQKQSLTKTAFKNAAKSIEQHLPPITPSPFILP